MAGRCILRSIVTLLLATWGLMLPMGCVPEGMPAYVDGGKSIVTVAQDKLWVYEPAGGAVKAYDLPPGDMQGKMLGGQIWVHAAGNTPQEGSCARFDWEKKSFVAGPAELQGDWVRGAVEGSWEGKKCLLVEVKAPAKEGEKWTCGVYSLPELKQVKTFEEDESSIAAEDGWRVRGEKELLDATGKSVVKLDEDFLKKVQINGPVHAQMSAEKDVLLLASVWQGGKTTFGVADVKTGKYLWGGECEPIRGRPVITRDEGWFLTNKMDGDPTLVSLVRYRKAEKAIGTPAGGAAVFEPKTVLTFGVSDSPVEYNLSPDGKEFVLLAVHEPDPPQLIFVPIRPDVTEKDVRVVELKEKK